MRILVDSLVYHDGGQVALGLRSENIATLKRSALIAGHTGYLSGVKWDMPALVFFKGKASMAEEKALEKAGFCHLEWHWLG